MGENTRTLFQIAKFGVVGLSSVGFYYLFLIAAVELFGLGLIAASVVAYLLSMIWNYLMQRNWTFAADTNHSRGVPLYILTHLVGMFLNSAVLYGVATVTGIHYAIAQVFATGIVAIWSYLALRLVVFRESEQPASE